MANKIKSLRVNEFRMNPMTEKTFRKNRTLPGSLGEYESFDKNDDDISLYIKRAK